MLTTLERATIRNAMRVSQKLLIEVKPYLDALNAIYDAPGGASSTITQENLDLVPEFSSLTKQQLDAAMNALTFTVRVDLNNAFVQLSQLSERAQ